MRNICFTSDKGNWALKGFAHQWNKYCGEPVEIVGYTPVIDLPANFKFTSLGKFEDYPANKWSDALIKYLNMIDDEFLIIMLEDYWLCRPVNGEAVSRAIWMMNNTQNVARMCLTTDRLYSRKIKDFASVDWLDVFESDKTDDYNMSFQTSIWRRSALLELLVPGETPWEAETNGTERINASQWHVLGTRQWPMKYTIVVNKGEVDKKGEWMFPPRTLTQNDWKELEDLHYV